MRASIAIDEKGRYSVEGGHGPLTLDDLGRASGDDVLARAYAEADALAKMWLVGQFLGPVLTAYREAIERLLGELDALQGQSAGGLAARLKRVLAAIEEAERKRVEVELPKINKG